MTGILLRKNLKDNFIDFPPALGEIVLATDTDEIGMILNGEIIWQEWSPTIWTQIAFALIDQPTPSLGVDGDRAIQTSQTQISEYIKENGNWKLLEFGKGQVFVHANYEPNFHNAVDFPYLGKYSDEMLDSYVPEVPQDVITNKYLSDTINHIRLDGMNSFDEGYVPSEDDNVVTQGFLKDSVNFVIPSHEPCVQGGGALWNDNGVLSISRDLDPNVGYIRYYTDSPLAFETGIGGRVVKTPSNGYIDIISNDHIYLSPQNGGQNSVTKIEVLRYGEMTNWTNLALDCVNLTVFEDRATDESKVEYFSNAWRNCSSLVSFSGLDTSSGIYFDNSWRGCANLQTLPRMDFSRAENLNWTFAQSGFTELNGIDARLITSTTKMYASFSYCPNLTVIRNLKVSTETFGCFDGNDPIVEFNGCDFSKFTNLTSNSAFSNLYNLERLIDCDLSGLTSFSNYDNTNDFRRSMRILDGVNMSNVIHMRQAFVVSQIEIIKNCNFSSALDCRNICSGANSLVEFSNNDLSSATTVGNGWENCNSLSNFSGNIITSSCLDFTESWKYCISLPHCPGGNEVTIPAGAITTNMCLGI